MDSMAQLKLNLREADYPFFSDEQLQDLLDRAGGDVDEASQLGLIIKAECDQVAFSDLDLESSREYWLSLSRLYRRSRTGGMNRGDRV